MNVIVKAFILLMMLPNISVCKPLLETNSNNWDKETRLFVGNCKAELPMAQQILPKTNWTAQSELLALVHVGTPKAKYSSNAFPLYASFRKNNQNRSAIIYALANHAKLKGNLYQIDVKTGQELQRYDLPNLEYSSLFTADVYYNNAWCSLLILEMNNDILGFDVTDPRKPLKPIFKIAMQMITTPPKLVRLNNQFGFLVGGKLNNQNVLLLSLMSDKGASITSQTWVLETPLGFIVPVDENGLGIVNKVYVADQNTLSELSVNTVNPSFIRKLGIKMLSAPCVLKETRQAKNKLIFLANHVGKEGVYHFGANLDSSGTELKLIVGGQYNDIRVRYGRLLVIPKSHQDFPKIFNLPDYLVKEIEWTYLYKGKTPADEIVSAKLLWDGKKSKDILVTMNLSGQLNILEAAINKDQGGRVGWRKWENEE